MKLLRLNKSRTILQAAYSWYQKRSAQLSPNDLASMERQMTSLESAIAAGNREEASSLAQSLQEFTKLHCKKSTVDYFKEILVAIFIALLLAVVVRQMWFELYEIPTGSMRPTFREQDRVAVTKTPFGINLPMSTGHVLFDPSLVVRGGGITFTSEDIHGLDEDTMFMWVIPYKKRLIKRLIGKPGDSLYFYGGKIYGVDANGKPLKELIDAPWMHKGQGQNFDLEHIPFISFNGEMQHIPPNQIIFTQMGQPIGRLLLGGIGNTSEIFNGKKWIKEDPLASRTTHRSLKSYTDFFGMKNFAMARLLTAKELNENYGSEFKNLPEGVLYLELSHDPDLNRLQTWKNHITGLRTLKSIIPLKQEHLDRIMENMYTARFVIKNGRGTRYDAEGTRFNSDSPVFKDVPDGKYEFYRGKLEEVGWGAVTYAAKSDNPLYSHEPKNVQKLFNMGIEWSTVYMPSSNFQATPTRYAYFRNGDLYLLGAPIIQKDEPLLKEFLNLEEKREKASSSSNPYIAFKDHGPPLKDGEYDVEFIRTFGVTIPDRQYLVLGDNHAMSRDSRAFGFIPEANLQGSPSLILWPPGPRLGFPWQAPYTIFELPRLVIWSIVTVLTTIWYFYRRRYLNRPITLHHQMRHREA